MATMRFGILSLFYLKIACDDSVFSVLVRISIFSMKLINKSMVVIYVVVGVGIGNGGVDFSVFSFYGSLFEKYHSWCNCW